MHAGVLHAMHALQEDVRKSIPCMELIQALNPTYLSKCEEKDLSSTYKSLRLDKGKVDSKHKLAANAICDKGLLNYQMGGVIVLWTDINT